MDQDWDEYCAYMDSKRYQEEYEAEMAARALLWEDEDDEDEPWNAPEDPDDSWRYVDAIDYASGL